MVVLNIFKLKSVEKNALEYIHQTYPEFIVDDILVRHEWKSNHSKYAEFEFTV